MMDNYALWTVKLMPELTWTVHFLL